MLDFILKQVFKFIKSFFGICVHWLKCLHIVSFYKVNVIVLYYSTQNVSIIIDIYEHMYILTNVEEISMMGYMYSGRNGPV